MALGAVLCPGDQQTHQPALKLAGASYRIDETYLKAGKQWKYL